MEEATALAFSPDCKTLAVGGTNRRGGSVVVLFDTTTGVEKRRFPTSGKAIHLTFAPSGQIIAVSFRRSDPNADAKFVVLDLIKGETHRLSAEAPIASRFTPDGRTLWGYTPGETADHAWDTATWREAPPLRDGEGRPKPPPEVLSTNVAITPSGRFIEAGDDEEGRPPSYCVVDEETGRTLAEIRLRPMPATPRLQDIQGFSPDGRFLILENPRRVYHLCDWEAGKASVFTRLDAPEYMQGLCRFSPDGRNLSASIVHTVTSWTDVLPETPRDWLDDHLKLVPHYQVRVEVWDTATGRPRIDVRCGGNTPIIPADCLYVLSPDGRTLAAQCRRGVVALWDVPPAR